MSAPIHEEDWDDRHVPIGSGRGLPSIRDLLGQSTSAELRRTQEAYAASQADLTAAKAEGDRISMRLMDTTVERDELAATVDRMANDHIRLLKRNTLAEAELATARAELTHLRALVTDLSARDETGGTE